MFEIGFVFQNPYHHVHGHARLYRLRIRGGRDDGAALDTAMDTRTIIVGKYLDLLVQSTPTQDTHRRLGTDRGTDDVVRLVRGILTRIIEYGFNQFGLGSLAGIALFRRDNFDMAVRQCLIEPPVSCSHPGCPLRPRKPGNRHLTLVSCSEFFQVFTGLKGIVIVINGGAGGDVRRVDTIDQVQHGHALRTRCLDQVIEPFRRDGTENQAIGLAVSEPLFKALFDLLALYLQAVIATGLVDGQIDPQAPGFIDQAKIHGQPVRVFQMWNRHTEIPASLCLLQWHIGFLHALTLRVERRVPDIHLHRVPVPCLGSTGQKPDQGDEHDSRTRHSAV